MSKGKHTHTHSNSSHSLRQTPHAEVCTHTVVCFSSHHTCAEATPTTTPHTCVGTTQTVNVHSVNLCHMCADTTDTHTLTPGTHRCGQTFSAHVHIPVTYTPLLLAEPHHSSSVSQLLPPLPLLPTQPQPTSSPDLGYPSPGLLSCRMMARKKSWENMALVPSPSCLHPPSSQPLQPSQLGSQPGAGLQRKAHPAPFSPGQSACQARSSPTWRSLRRGQDHHGRGPPLRGDGGSS